MDRPLVSIIIPVYNSGAYVDETIKSALQQTWPNKEIILVDDGSTDNSLATIKRHESASVKVFRQGKKGASAARNKGLSEAKGDYIQFLDSDDLLNNTKIEDQLNLLINNPGYIGLCTTVHFFNGDDPIKQPVITEWYTNGSDDPADFLVKLYGGGLIGPTYGGMIAMHAWLTPKEIIDKAGNWNEELTVDDDGEFFCRVVLASKGIKYAPKAMSYYRKFKNTNTLSAQKSYDDCKKALQATMLKTGHLLTVNGGPKAKLASSRLFWDNAFNFYPEYRDLAMAAQYEAKKITPGFNYSPYNIGLKKQIANIIGWKPLAYLQYFKNHILR
ncbi:MAG: glycosyltransferase family 2 protein [Bacteroidota bacterium]